MMKCICSPALTKSGTSWGGVDIGDKCHNPPFLLLFSSRLLLVLIGFILWICMSYTLMRHKPPWHASIIFCSIGFSIPGLLMKHFTYDSHASSSSLHQTSGYFLMSVVQQMIMTHHGWLEDLPWTPFVGVQILTSVSFMLTAMLFCVSIVTLAAQDSHLAA